MTSFLEILLGFRGKHKNLSVTLFDFILFDLILFWLILFHFISVHHDPIPSLLETDIEFVSMIIL